MDFILLFIIIIQSKISISISQYLAKNPGVSLRLSVLSKTFRAAIKSSNKDFTRRLPDFFSLV